MKRNKTENNIVRDKVRKWMTALESQVSELFQLTSAYFPSGVLITRALYIIVNERLVFIRI